jgi:branched-chain amino acid transport system ATP-binding protein
MTASVGVRTLRVGYGPIAALRGVSLDVEPGEVVAVVGPNGAGKTTLLRAIAGLAPVADGEVTIDGTTVTGWPVERVARLGVSLVPEGRHIFGRMTVGENLRVASMAVDRGADRAAAIAAALERFPALKGMLNKRAALLSGGERQQLAIARALATRPRLLLLDEPSLGLAPVIVDRLFEAIESLRGSGVTILLVEQNAARAVAMADRSYVLRTGLVRRSGARSELLSDDAFVHDYAGFGA